jgi:transmembrane protein DUF3556
MSLLRPTPPPYDPIAWSSKPFAERARLACEAWALQGYGTPAFAYAVHALKVALYVGAWAFFCGFTPGLGGLSTIDQWWLSPIAFQKAILWNMLFEGLGFGCGFGPLTGRYFPPVGGFLYFLRPGTTKLPPWPGLPVLGGVRRTWLDVALYLAVVVLLLRALVAPALDVSLVAPNAVLVPLLGLADRTAFLALRPEHYWTTIVCFALAGADADADPSGWIAGAKAVQLALWFWAGVSKFNHHFSNVVCVMTSNSPFARVEWLRRRMYRRYPDDLRPSWVATAMGHVGTALELGVPLVLGLSRGGWSLVLGMALMLLLHGFITGNVPMGVPIEWNVMVVYGAFALFWAHPEVSPLAFARDLGPASALLTALLGVMLVALPLLGNLLPSKISFLLAMRFYAGNWAFGVWLFRGESYRKLDRLTKSSAWTHDQLARFYDRPTTIGLISKLMAFRLMHLHGRALPVLIPKAVERLEEYEYLDGELVAGLVLGWNFGDGHLHHEALLRAVQAQCDFAEGELRCIFVEAQPLGRPQMGYRIHDAKTGLVEAGVLDVREMRERQPWAAPDARAQGLTGPRRSPAGHALPGREAQRFAQVRRQAPRGPQAPHERLGRGRAPPPRVVAGRGRRRAAEPLDLVVDGLDGLFEAREAAHRRAVEGHLPGLAARGPAQHERLARAALGPLEVQPHAVPAERKPRVRRDRAHLAARALLERIEALGALLDLVERHGPRLELEARVVELELPPDLGRLGRVAAPQIDLVRHPEERGQGAEAQRRQVDEVEHEAVGLAGREAGAAADALGVQARRAGRARHRDARDAGVVEALGQHRDVGEHGQAARPEVGERLRARGGRHLAVHQAGGHADGVERPGEVAGVGDGDAEGDGAPIARQLLNRPGHERVALFDVDRLGQPLFVEVEAPARDARQVFAGRDPKAPQARQVAVFDHLGQRARVNDALEDGVEALAVAALGGGGEAEQRAGPVGLEGADLPQNAQVVVGRGVVALVVDDQADVAARHHPAEAPFVQRPDRAHQHLRVGPRALFAPLDRDDGLALHRAGDLLARLPEQLFAVRQHQHLPAGEAREVREDDGLAGPRRQAHQKAPQARSPRREHGLDGLALVGAQLGRGRGAFGRGHLRRSPARAVAGQPLLDAP